MNKQSRSFSFILAVSMHLLLIVFLVISFERTIKISMEEEAPAKIIDAVMINNRALQQEIARLDAIEAKKRNDEKAREEALVRKEKEAKEKRIKEEKLAQELKEKNDKLKKEAEEQRLVQIKEEKERQLKLKQQQEELKKIAKEKEIALLAKQKAEEEKKAAELEKQQMAAKQKAEEEKVRQAANLRVKQDQISQYAMLMRNKIHQHWRQPLGVDFGGFTCKISVKLMPTGEVVEATVVVSSGNIEFDRSTELAIRKASPLPMPQEPDIAKEFRQFTLTFHPEAA